MIGPREEEHTGVTAREVPQTTEVGRVSRRMTREAAGTGHRGKSGLEKAKENGKASGKMEATDIAMTGSKTKGSTVTMGRLGGRMGSRIVEAGEGEELDECEEAGDAGEGSWEEYDGGEGTKRPNMTKTGKRKIGHIGEPRELTRIGW